MLLSDFFYCYCLISGEIKTSAGSTPKNLPAAAGEPPRRSCFALDGCSRFSGDLALRHSVRLMPYSCLEYGILRSLGKDDRAGTGDYDPMLQMRPYRPGEYTAFDIPSALLEVCRSAFMRYRFHILFNNRTFVQICRCIVRGGTDHLYPAFPCSAVGVPAHECREKRVVDVDYA